MSIKLISSVLAMVVLLFGGCATSYTNIDKNSNNYRYLSDKNGMTLYTFDKDKPNVSNCYGECEKKWPVFYGDVSALHRPGDVSEKDFGVITRKNGALQTTYKKKPLYYFFKDTKPNEVKGNGKKGVWHIVK